MIIRDKEVHLLVVGYDSFGKQLVMEAEKYYVSANKHHPFTITVFNSLFKKATAVRISFVPFDSEEANLMDVIEAEE